MTEHAKGPVEYFEKDGLWYTKGFGTSRVHSNRGKAYNYSLDMNLAHAQGQSEVLGRVRAAKEKYSGWINPGSSRDECIFAEQMIKELDELFPEVSDDR